jgi:hypothetical protein
MNVTDFTTPRNKQLALTLLSLTQFVIVIDASIINVALRPSAAISTSRRRRCRGW